MNNVIRRGLALSLVLMAPAVIYGQVLRKRSAFLMGGRFDITIVTTDSLTAERHIDTVIREISRIENLISDWKPSSQVSQVNASAGIRPVKVDREVFELTERAIALSVMSGGAFDISFAAMDRIWKFDGSMTAMPSADAIRKSVAKVGYRNIVLDKMRSTIFLRLPGMKIGFGALGEGYAADRCRDMMLARGVRAGIVNGTGDMTTWGHQPDGRPWNVGLTNPKHPDKLLVVLPVTASVVTSGSYEKFVIFGGKRYSHIINPATGYPASGLLSVTVIGPSAETANGCSTSMMVLGKDAGLAFIRRFPGYRYVMITDEGQVIASEGLGVHVKSVR